MRLWLTMLCLLLIMFAGLHSPPHASAGLSLGGFGVVTWDRVASPASSPGYTFTIAPNVDPGPAQLYAFSIHLEIRSTLGATGTLGVGGLAAPESNRVFDLYFNDFEGWSSTTYEDGSTSFSVERLPLSDVVVGGERNAVNVAFTSADDALGVFEVWARPQFTAYWADTPEANTQHSFTSVPGGDPVFMGSINAVPEPSSFAVLGVIGCLVGLVSFRRRMRARKAENRGVAC